MSICIGETRIRNMESRESGVRSINVASKKRLDIEISRDRREGKELTRKESVRLKRISAFNAENSPWLRRASVHCGQSELS